MTVFTGFLGAGKTSIILSLLPQLPKDYRVVLLKNEFGDIQGQSLTRTRTHPSSLLTTYTSLHHTIGFPVTPASVIRSGQSAGETV